MALDGFVKDVTRWALTGRVRTFEGLDSGAAVLEVGDARVEFALDSASIPRPGRAAGDTSLRITLTVSRAASCRTRQVGVSDGRPRDPFDQHPQRADEILSIPNIANEDVRFRTAVDPACEASTVLLGR